MSFSKSSSQASIWLESLKCFTALPVAVELIIHLDLLFSGLMCCGALSGKCPMVLLILLHTR